jgi:four helix bundle protein
MAAAFRSLIVWQKAFLLSQKVYGVTKNFPQDERYGLVDQMKRSSVSIASNIAE